jgi:hypothetical protein
MENSINPTTPPRPIINPYSNCWAPTRENNQQNDTGYDAFFNSFPANTNQAAPAPQVNPVNYPHPPIFYTPAATPEASDSDSEMDVDDMNNDLSDLHFGGNTTSYSSNSDEE